MMEILLSFTASFSVMERLSKLISDVSNIKEKQDNFQHSLYCLQPRNQMGSTEEDFYHLLNVLPGCVRESPPPPLQVQRQ